MGREGGRGRHPKREKDIGSSQAGGQDGLGGRRQPPELEEAARQVGMPQASREKAGIKGEGRAVTARPSNLCTHSILSPHRPLPHSIPPPCECSRQLRTEVVEAKRSEAAAQQVARSQARAQSDTTEALRRQVSRWGADTGVRPLSRRLPGARPG